MKYATYLFDQFAAIFKERRREGCLLSHADIDSMCLHFREVFVLWDRAFSLARTVNPMGEEIITYQSFVSAAVEGSRLLGCPVTPKVHTMLRHVQWQMTNLHWGLGDKMEDCVERLHQWGMQQRRQFWTVQNPLVRISYERAREGSIPENPSQGACSGGTATQRASSPDDGWRRWRALSSAAAGGRALTVVSNQSFVEWRRRWGWSGAKGGEG